MRIFHILFYDSKSGKSLLNLTVEEFINESNLDFFSNFFSVLKHFSKEYLFNQKLRILCYDNFKIRLFSISELNTDIVLIYRAEDKDKIIESFLTLLTNILLENKRLFLSWDGANIEHFELLRKPLLNAIIIHCFENSIQ